MRAPAPDWAPADTALPAAGRSVRPRRHGSRDAWTFWPGYGSPGVPCEARAQGTFLERIRHVEGSRRRYLAAEAVLRRRLWPRQSYGRFSDHADPPPADFGGGVCRPGQDLQPHCVTAVQCIGAGAVAADFAVKYAQMGRADFLVGLILFAAAPHR